jgi:phage tail sheath gpL-like
MSVANLQQVPLASGDTGVASVQSVTLSASTGLAGNFGIVIGRRVAVLPASNANGSNFVAATVQDAFTLGMPQLYDHSCLWVVGGYGAGFPGPITGMLGVAQG